MKLRKGVGSYKVPPIGELISAVLDTGVEEMQGHRMALEVVSAGDIEGLGHRYKKSTRPRAVALVGDRLFVRPIPGEDAELEITYTPPAVRI